MAMDLNKTKAGDMDSLVDDYSVDEIILDAETGDKEYAWINTNFDHYMGYYKTIPELGSCIDTKAFWVTGRGYTTDSETEKTLKKIVGWGKDTFTGIMENAVRVYNIGGDSFSEIIRANTIVEKVKNKIHEITGLGKYTPGKGKLLNLKPLNPSKMTTFVNGQGMLKRYEYNRGTKSVQTFEPNEIFHLAWNRVANEVHGISIIRKIEQIILMRNEAMTDMKTVFHRYVKPLWIWSLDTDDTTKIAAFQAKADAVVDTGDNLYIPKGAAEAERISIPQYSTLDPLPWIDNLTQYFFQATNMPDVILGSAKQTVEASAKILYGAFQQSTERNQLFVEENALSQLGVKFKFKSPPDIMEGLAADAKKDGPVNIDKNETKVNIKGKK